MCIKVVCPSVTWEPLLGLLQLLRALDGVRLVLGPPLGHLAVGLGHRPLQLGLALLLLLVLFAQQVTVVPGEQAVRGDTEGWPERRSKLCLLYEPDSQERWEHMPVYIIHDLGETRTLQSRGSLSWSQVY